MKQITLLLVSIILFSCSSDDVAPPKDYSEQNEKDIKAYVASKNLDATRSKTGLYYVINEPGTGKQPTGSSTVKVVYKGSYLDGKVFEDNKEGITTNLQQVIKGWTEGITYFKEGGKGILIVPAHLGYGSTVHRGIPAGSVLVFDIHLLEVK